MNPGNRRLMTLPNAVVDNLHMAAPLVDILPNAVLIDGLISEVKY